MPNIMSPPPQSAARLRWIVLCLLVASSFLNYFDRQTVSVLKTTLKEVFAIDDAGYALILNVFTGGYAVAYVISGWIVDRVGARLAMTLFIAGWSIVTVGCGLSTEFWMIILFRLMLGLFEPGIHPVIIRSATLLTKEGGRGVFMTIASMGGNIATVIAVPVISYLSIVANWRLTFVIPGILGLIVASLWWRHYREEPCEIIAASPIVTAAPNLSWPSLWRQKALWGVVLARFVSDPVLYFCMFWMPGYLQEAKKLTMSQLGAVGWIPFLSSTVLGLGFVAISDRCGHRYGVRGRKLLVSVAAFFGPLCLFIPHTTSVATAIILFSLISVVCIAWVSSLAPIISAIFPAGNVASVWGIAGAFGAAGAIIMNYVVGQATKLLEPGTIFVIMSVLHPCAAVILNLLVRNTPIETPSEVSINEVDASR